MSDMEQEMIDGDAENEIYGQKLYKGVVKSVIPIYCSKI